MSMKKSIDEASKKARLRDYDNEQVLSDQEIQSANNMQTKANERGMKLVPERKVKSKVRFGQFIQNNWQYLLEINYLTMAEKAFLCDIAPFTGFLSNALVEDPKSKIQTPCSQVSLGKKVGKSESQMSKMLKKLIDKGILARSETGSDGKYNSVSYAIFINPNIFYCGDRDTVNESLKVIFSRPPKALKNLPDKLF